MAQRSDDPTTQQRILISLFHNSVVYMACNTFNLRPFSVYCVSVHESTTFRRPPLARAVFGTREEVVRRGEQERYFFAEMEGNIRRKIQQGLLFADASGAGAQAAAAVAVAGGGGSTVNAARSRVRRRLPISLLLFPFPVFC